VVRLLYPLQPVSDVPQVPPTPRYFARLSRPRFFLHPPPPPPPPPQPDWK
jgi:hypothetical protein